MTRVRTGYFDCFSGISGDMVLGALVDAGADRRAIEAELRKLGLEGWSISAEKVKRGAIAATHVKVETSEGHHHRGLSIILGRIEKAQLAPRAAERATRIFTRLAEAEAKVHAMPVENVHFHEVGAVDSIIDIVGACVGFELLGLDDFVCSAMDVGGGTVMTAHGLLPVPAPATTELLAGAPVHTSGVQKELVTPTGAAIATTLASGFGQVPAMTMRAVGYGAGTADLKQKANVLRILIGERDHADARGFRRGLGFAGERDRSKCRRHESAGLRLLCGESLGGRRAGRMVHGGADEEIAAGNCGDDFVRAVECAADDGPVIPRDDDDRREDASRRSARFWIGSSCASKRNGARCE